MTETIKVTCRACEGDKRVDVCVGHDWSPKYGGGPVWALEDCTTCNGTGEEELTRADVDDIIECLSLEEGKSERQRVLIATRDEAIFRLETTIAALREDLASIRGKDVAA